jgi:hypothetical protein
LLELTRQSPPELEAPILLVLPAPGPRSIPTSAILPRLGATHAAEAERVDRFAAELREMLGEAPADNEDEEG